MAMHNRHDSGPQGRLLLVDGDEKHAALVAETLAGSLGHGMRIIIAAGGKQAADLLRV